MGEAVEGFGKMVELICMDISKYKRIYLLQALLTVLNTGFVAVLYIYFFKQHVSIAEFLLAEGLGALAVSFFIAFRGVFHVRRDMRLGFILFGIGFAVLFLPFYKSLFFTYTILRTMGGIIFFVPYNIVLFDGYNKDKSLQAMTNYWLVGAVMGIIGPLMGTFILVQGGMVLFIGAALLFLILGIAYAGIVPSFSYVYTPKQLFSRLDSLRTVVAVDGALHKVWAIVTIFALLYFPTEVKYGGFLSFVSLFAMFFMIYIAKISDVHKKRMDFIWPFSVFSASVAVLFGFVTSAGMFVALTIVLRFFAMLVEPLRANILLDKCESNPLNWIARELWLNIGRAAIFIAAYFIIKLSEPMIVFIMCGLLHIFFPFLVQYKRIYVSTH